MDKQFRAMTQETKEEPIPRSEYDLHIKVTNEMRSVLKDTVELAYKMGVITESDLVDLMNIIIGWGITILKRLQLDCIDYK